ncbi:hypothetical protein ACL6C3_29540 [Capilliphycus salinus ALCB114379]|uniref:hypothetical protein n=1 Tax=Capilliphycus salinus TaxID=2768948 RepID=UPI0039A59D7E
MSEQIEKIKQLIKTAKNVKTKAMYEDLLAKLQADQTGGESGDKIEEKPQPALTPKPQRTAPKPQPTAPKSSEVQPQKQQNRKPKPIEIVRSSQSSITSTPETVNQELKSSDEKSINKKPKTSPTVKDSDSPSVPEPDRTPSNADSQSESSEEEKVQAYFQGIGIIKGEVTLTEERSVVTIGNKEYRLFYIPNRRKKAYDALKKEIETTGNTTLRLIVYPKILHFPKKEQPHQVAFQLVGFVGSQASKSQLNSELQDFEFKFSGLWQFIPVCRTPCISVFRNFNTERLNWIKEADAAKKVKFMKASHIPILWKDSPVRPFRFNPKLEKEQQGQTYFVQIKAKFLPGRDVFGFTEQLSEPMEKAPGFLKASKKLKAEALKETKERKQQQQQEQSEVQE